MSTKESRTVKSAKKTAVVHTGNVRRSNSDSGELPLELTAIGPNHELSRPIPIVVESCDGEFIASFVEANVHASGESRREAIRDLQSYIGDVYDEFVALGAERLGPGPREEFAAMQFYIIGRRADVR